MSGILSAVLPWMLVPVAIAAGTALGLVYVALRQALKFGAAWLAGRLSRLPILPTVCGCDDCSAEAGQLHRYAGCPGNVRQHENRLGLRP